MSVLLAAGLVSDDTVLWCKDGDGPVEVSTVSEYLGLDESEPDVVDFEQEVA